MRNSIIQVIRGTTNEHFRVVRVPELKVTYLNDLSLNLIYFEF